MQGADILILGGGVAGLSAAAALAPHARVIVLEAEDALGVHSSGRSAAFSHFGIGDETVRALTFWSRPHLLSPPEGFGDTPPASLAPALFIATEDMLEDLAALEARMRPFAPDLRSADEAEMARLFPALRVGGDGARAGLVDPAGLRIDSDALLQGYARLTRRAGGAVLTGRRIARIDPAGGGWRVETDGGEAFAAPVLVNAAGAWADAVAQLAGVAPLGLSPLRRTAILLDPPAGADLRLWPFVKTARDDFYALPEGGRVMVSPVDEVPDTPCDARPEDYDVALAAWKAERYTTLSVARIAHRWAGLRTFAPDRVPVAGFAPAAPGFFWLAGQGGYGLQTAPAMAAAAASLILRQPWPEGLARRGAGAEKLRPERFVRP
jgi:D-arginine dehydrogenase